MGSMHPRDDVMTPAQRDAWSRLWHRLLQPVDDVHNSGDDNGRTAESQDVTPDDVDPEDGAA
jgi:hypothetical protein